VGTYISGYAPIKGHSGKTIGVLGLDMNVSDVLQLTRERFSPWFWFIGFFMSLVAFFLLTNYLKKIG